MLGRTRRIHFVGIGGIGMSGIAELLANLGYEVSGSDAKASEITERLAGLGVRIARGHDAAHVGQRGRRGDLVGDPGGQPGGGRGAAAGNPGDPARGDARGADAAPLRHRHRRRARQDDDDVDGGAGAGARGPGSDRRHRRPAERLRQQRAARARRLHGRRGGRKRPIVPEADAGDRGDYEHRPRTHGKLRQLGRPAAGVRRLRQQGAVLRHRRGVRGRRAGAGARAEDDAPRRDLRARRQRRHRDRRAT